MTKLFSKSSRKFVSILNIFLVLFQNIAPLFFIAPQAFANTTDTAAEVSAVTLAFDADSNELLLNGQATAAVDYLLTYSLDEADSVENAITGRAEVDEDGFSENLYVGTCSTDDECTPNEFDQGKIVFQNADYEASFEFINDVLWLTHDGVSTVADVAADQAYVAPQNDEVSVEFTSLPDESGSLSIEEVTLSDEQVAVLGAVSHVAYDITSSMENGSFKYDLKLPVPEESENVQVKYAETVEDLDQAEEAVSEKTGKEVTAKELNHFTVFVVVDPNVAGNGNACTVASITGTCYDTLQEAVDNAVSGETIELASDISLSQEVIVNKALEIDGNGFTVTSPFTKTDNSNNSAIGVHSDDVIIKDLTVDGTGGTNLHGINIYVVENILLDNVTAKNYRSGVVVNGSTVTVNNITTSGNSWHGINVDLGSGVTDPAELTINGTSSHTDTLHIYVDDSFKDVTINDTLGQYSISNPVIDGRLNDRLYTHQDIIPPTVPALTSPADGAYVPAAGLFLDWSDVTDPSGPVTYHYQSSYGSAVGAGNELSSVIYSSGVLGSSQINASGSADNSYYWQVNACDAVGNCSDWSGPWEVNIDSTAPDAPIINSPAEDQYFNSTPILNDWTDVNDDSGIDHYRIEYQYDDGHTFSGAPYRTTTNSQRNHTPGISEQGGVEIRVQAFDNAGNEGAWSEWRHYFYDATAPDAPSLVSPSDDDYVNGNPTQTWNSVSDADHYIYESYLDAGLTTPVYTTTVNGTSRTVGGNQTIAFWWMVKAVDAAGNESPWSDAWKLNVDNTAPTATIDAIKYSNGTQEASKFVTNYSDPVILGTATDNNSVASVELVVDGNFYVATLTGNNWEADITDTLTDGLYDLTVTATDIAGNETVETQSIRIDTLAPTAIYKQFDGTTEVTGTTPYVNDLARLSFTAEYEDADPSANLFSDSYVIFEAQDDGSFGFSSNGKQSFCSWRSTPNLVDISGADTFSLTTNEAFTNCESTLSDGEYYMAHQVSDAATRKDIPSINQFRDVLGLHFVIDTVPPSSTITTFNLENGGEKETATFDGLIEGTATDGSGSGVDYVNLSVAYLPFGADLSATKYWSDDLSDWVDTEVLFKASGADSWNYQLTDVPEGVYTVTSHAVDKAGNEETTYVIKIVYDKTIPEVTLSIDPTSPDGDNSWYQTLATITLTATDNYLLDKIEYKWNSDSWTTYSDPINPPAEGQNILYYRGIDQVGNTTEVGVKEVKYDATSPNPGPENVEITDFSLPTGNLKWDLASDAISGIRDYDITWKLKNDGGIPLSFGKNVSATTTSTQIDGLTEGEWEIRVKALDEAGNWTETLLLFTIHGSSGESAGTSTTTSTPLGPTGGTVLGTTTPNATTFAQATTDTGSILGDEVATKSDEEKSAPKNEAADEKQGNILGASTSCTPWLNYLPLILLALQTLLIIGFGLITKRSSFISMAAITLISLAAFYLLRNETCFADNSFLSLVNRWFVVITTLVGLTIKGVVGVFTD